MTAWTDIAEGYPNIGELCEVVAGTGTREYQAALIEINGEKIFRSPEGIRVWNVTRWRYK